MIDRLFLDHPRSVGESYREHLRVAGGFGLIMVAGGLASLVHALVPALFTRTGSSVVRRLHAIMAARQPGARAPWDQPDWRPEYEI